MSCPRERRPPRRNSEAGAINGVLTVMCGGDPDAFARAQPVTAIRGVVFAAGSHEEARVSGEDGQRLLGPPVRGDVDSLLHANPARWDLDEGRVTVQPDETLGH